MNVANGTEKPSHDSREAIDREVIDNVIRGIADYETEVLNSDEIFVADEIFAMLVGLVPPELEFDFVFRERRRFKADRPEVDLEWLYFPYLSFSFCNGRLEQFTSPEAVQGLVSGRRSSGQYSLVEHPKFVLCVPKSAPPYFERIARRCAKLVTAFYYACGSHDHFSANIARRHMTTYLSEHYTKDPENLIAYLEQAYDVRVAYAFQTTKQDDDYETVSDKTILLKELTQYAEFREDLNSAVRRKANFFGVTPDFAWHYSIHSFVDFDEAPDLHAVRKQPGKQQRRLLRRGFAVVAKSAGRLPLDVVKVVPLLFDAHRSSTRAKDRDNFFRGVQKHGQILEDEFASAPPESVTSFRTRIWTALAEPLQQLLSHDMMDWCQVFLVDAFRPRLTSVIRSTASQDIGPARRASFFLKKDKEVPWVKAFLENRVQHIASVEAHPDPGKRWKATLVPRTASVFAAPLIVGRMTVGSVVIGSKWTNLFEPEMPYLEAVATGIGDFIHRMELVADISWLSRISFLHSARHELENFRRRLMGDDRERLEEIVHAYSGLHKDELIDRPVDVAEIVERCRLRSETKGDAPKIKLLGKYREICVDKKDAAVVASILDQLLANARSHSLVSSDPFSVEVDGAVGTGATVSIRYSSSSGKILQDLLPRVCIAPIPDANSTSFHFGLFLCAVQARMLGGRASARQDAKVAFKRAPLELAFEIPISIVRKGIAA
jgi:hypothetical protein